MGVESLLLASVHRIGDVARQGADCLLEVTANGPATVGSAVVHALPTQPPVEPPSPPVAPPV